MEIVKGLVSVIMSNYNTPEIYLREAIESVLNQTYSKLEFIIIDDCSTDESLDIIESYIDERIVIIKNEKNLGITKSLNRGLYVAKGEFIARMDADDVCLNNRFERQVEFLRKNPTTIVCGTGVELIGGWNKEHSKKTVCRDIPDRESYRINLLFGNYPNIVHPTAMFNHQSLLDNHITYNENYVFAQDYRMWVSCSNYGECVNMQEVLFRYRIHDNAVSSAKKELQIKCALEIVKEQLKQLHIELPNEYESIHMNFLHNRHEYDLKYKKWIKLIIAQNKKYHIYDNKKLEDILWGKWTEISYFELRKQNKVNRIIKILSRIPLAYVGELIKIRKMRINKNKER